MVEPRSGRIPLLLAFAYTTVVSIAWYRVQQAPTLWIPVGVSALPFVATSTRLGINLRATAAVLLLLWTLAGALSVGPTYAPSLVLMMIAYLRTLKGAGRIEARGS